MSNYNLTPAERETVINLNDADQVVRIWTAQQTVLTQLKKSSLTRHIKDELGGSTWEIDLTDFNLAAALRPKRKVSESQREASRERMKQRHQTSASE